MNTALITFGIQSVVRLGRITSDALEQGARDAGAVFPQLDPADFRPKVFVASFFNAEENQRYVVGEDAIYREYWAQNGPLSDPAAIDALLTAAIKISAERDGGLDRTLRPGGAIMVKQWSGVAAPVSPWARIVLTAGDIVLEYVATNPSILGADGTGEKVIAAYASNLADLLPDDGKFGAREQFIQRLGGAFLHAGLNTAGQHPEWVASEDHVAELIRATVTPLAESFPTSVATQLNWNAVADSLLGPASRAALGVVAENQRAFLGEDLRPDRAIGALTRALFMEAAETGLRDRFSKDGLMGLYRAALTVAADQPALFLGDDSGDEEAFARSLFASFMGIVRDARPPFDKKVALDLASTALQTVGQHVHRFVGDSDWEAAAADLVRALTTRLGTALETNADLGRMLSREQLTEIGRALLLRIADQPRGLLGSGNREWDGLLRAVALAMAADKKLLLTGDDWVAIVATAAEEAAANPGRLFALDPGDPDDVLAGRLIATVLSSAASVLEAPDLRDRTVLYGQTLRKAIEIVIRSAAGNPRNARAQLDALGTLVTSLNQFVAQNHESYGSKEWLHLFRRLLAGLLEGRAAPVLTIESASRLLQGAGA